MATRLLGKSATSETYLVTPDDGAAPYVEKRLAAAAEAWPELQADFEREACILQALGGRGVPRFLGHDMGPAGPQFRMEALAAAPLEAVPAAELATHVDAVVAEAFAALAAVHDAADEAGPLGVLHNDLSGSNVLVALAPTGARVWLVDFGLASYREGGPPNDGAFRGTLPTTAPERARGEAGDARSDLYALAASLVAARLGRPLRRVVDSDALALVLAAENPIVWGAAWDDLFGKATSPVLANCLAHDPADRPATARDALAWLAGRDA